MYFLCHEIAALTPSLFIIDPLMGVGIIYHHHKDCTDDGISYQQMGWGGIRLTIHKENQIFISDLVMSADVEMKNGQSQMCEVLL